MYEIKTSNYVKSKKILVDGNEWTMFPPGAGDELAMNQAQRRINLLEQKIKDSSATEADYDKYDELENRTYELFQKIFRDSTDDNSEVKGWLSSTPLVVIYAIMDDISKQVTEKDKVSGEIQAS